MQPVLNHLPTRKNDSGHVKQATSRNAICVLLLLIAYGAYIALLILLSSCATFNQSKFKNKTNHKDLIISKYGPSDLVKVEDGLETWVYDNSSFIKSNRRVVFNNENRIISNKKTLSPVAYVFNWTLWTLATVALVFVVTGGSIMVY